MLRLQTITGRQRPDGFALISVMTVLAVVVVSSVSLIQYLLVSRQSAKIYENDVVATHLAEAGLAKAVFCFNTTGGDNCGGTYGLNYAGERNVTLDNGRYSTFVSGSGVIRNILAVGLSPKGSERAIRLQLTSEPTVDTGTSFTKAFQADDSGIAMENNASVADGSIHANSSLSCKNNADIVGDVRVALAGGKIDNCDITGNAYADKIEGSDVSGDCYYQDSISKSSCAHKYGGQPTPAALPLPSFDLTRWRAAAEAGGVISGNYSPADNSILGPIKIIGNLTLGNNVDVTMNGPIWVTGNVTLGNNSALSLDADFGRNSSVLLADNPTDQANYGKVLISNNAQVNGSGDAKSFILVVSTNTSLSDSDPAINVQNNAGGGVFLAPNGTVRIHNNASATAAAGRRGFMDNNGGITYRNGLYDPTELRLADQPNGNWHAVTGTWTETSQ